MQKRNMIVAVDFDGTCCEHEYPNIGATVPHCIEVLKKIIQFGHQIMIYTMRDGKELEDAKNWYIQNGIPFTAANENIDAWSKSKKLYAHIYIDDAAIGCPLITEKYPGTFLHKRSYVDWFKVEKLLEDKGLFY